MTNIELAKTFYAAFDTSRPELLGGVLATDWKALPPVPGNPGGLAGQQATVGYLHSVFDDLSYRFLDVREAGPDMVVARAELAGIQVGEFLGVAPTGRRIVLATIEMHEIIGGRISATHHIEDFWGAYRQMVDG